MEKRKKQDKKSLATQLRLKGLSYTQIRAVVGVSKSTLSLWLREMPLSKDRISELQGKNEVKIEKFRNTMRSKKESLFSLCLDKEQGRIGSLTKRDMHLIALALYWAEGTKTWDSKTEITNSDPKLLLFFVQWMKNEGVDVKKIKAALHLYADMDIEQEISFWARTLTLSKEQFYKPRIKKVQQVSQRKGIGHGTCQIIFGSRAFNDTVHAGIVYLSSFMKNVQ